MMMDESTDPHVLAFVYIQLLFYTLCNLINDRMNLSKMRL